MQTPVQPAGGTAGTSGGAALVAACSVLPLLLLVAKVQFLPAKPLTSTLTPQLLHLAVSLSSPASEGKGGVSGFTAVGPGGESSVGEVGGCPG